MKAFKERSAARTPVDTTRASCGAVSVILGAPGTGKSHEGAVRAKDYEEVLFLSIAAQLLDQAPKEFANRMTIAAFLLRSTMIIGPRVCIYIDEVSMVDAATMTAILNRCRPNPFIMTGDPFQIPPIRGDGTKVSWWFESDAYLARMPSVSVLSKQYRLVGDECCDIRALVSNIQGMRRDWQYELCDFVGSRLRRVAPVDAHLLVFTNRDVRSAARRWATAAGHVLDRHGLCVGMPVYITKNRIDSAASTASSVVYKHRNGQRGVLCKIEKTCSRVVLDCGKKITVRHGGPTCEVPQVKSAVAQTVDGAQGLTIDSHVHVIVDSYMPSAAHLIVAATRSRHTTFGVQRFAEFQMHVAGLCLDEAAVAFSASVS